MFQHRVWSQCWLSCHLFLLASQSTPFSWLLPRGRQTCSPLPSLKWLPISLRKCTEVAEAPCCFSHLVDPWAHSLAPWKLSLASSIFSRPPLFGFLACKPPWFFFHICSPRGTFFSFPHTPPLLALAPHPHLTSAVLVLVWTTLESASHVFGFLSYSTPTFQLSAGPLSPWMTPFLWVNP